MNDSLTRAEQKLLHVVVQMGGEANYFRLHRRLLLSAGQIGSIVRDLSARMYLETTDTGVRLTDTGLRYAHQKRLTKMPEHDKTWVTIPAEFLAPQVDPFRPFAPSYTRYCQEKSSGKRFTRQV